MTDAEQRPTPTDSGLGAGGVGAAEPDEQSGASGSDAVAAAPVQTKAPVQTPVEDNPFAPPPEDAHDAQPMPPSPWGAPPQQPYGQVRPGPVQPWGAERPREPEQPHAPWGDPNRYGPVDRRPDPREDPDRRYRDQRENPTPQRPQRDLKTRWALGLSLGSTACTMLAIYQGLATFPAWMVGSAAGLAFAVAAFVLSISAQRTAALKHQRASEATASMVSASVSGVLAGLLLVASIVWWTPFKDYAKCMEGANTQVAEKMCLTQLENSTGMSTSR
ncbi:hypothetical protein ABH935_007540 [Catenulispora sp. GAS73]|uniref:hypothetical protein n=1 Tax=Catenulispora sp. GAS73 TaxID=3156269 RepID=UPI003511F7A6